VITYETCVAPFAAGDFDEKSRVRADLRRVEYARCKPRRSSMCRMFALAAARSISARALLRDAPRSLCALSNEHPDGWGIATHDGADWDIHRSTACAARCDRYAELADRVRARLVIAHIRQKTVGPTALANTHPFHRGPFVFAHNGTIRPTALASLVAFVSPMRLAEVAGDTDSERLFAFVLTRIDAAPTVEAGVISAVRTLHELEDPGTATFLLSCGARIYAHRLGRSLFSIERGDQRRTLAVAVASERLTAEPWRELADRSLVAIEAGTLRAVIDPVITPLAA
jgi:glutamine amidotransferase